MMRGATKNTEVLRLASPKERKKLLATERWQWRTGEWGNWERLENPRRFSPGWLGEVDHVRRNRVFSVLIRDWAQPFTLPFPVKHLFNGQNQATLPSSGRPLGECLINTLEKAA